MENKWITAIIFVISSLLAVLIAYFIPLKVSNKTKLIWAGIAVGCSLLVVGLSQVTSFYVASIVSVVLGLTTIILFWSKGIGKENDEEELPKQDDLDEVEGNIEHSIVYPSTDSRANPSEKLTPGKMDSNPEDVSSNDEVEVSKMSIENLMIEPIALEKKEQETKEVTEDNEQVQQQPLEQKVSSYTDRKEESLSEDEIQTLSNELNVDFEEMKIRDFEHKTDKNVDVCSFEVEELPEQETEVNDSVSGESEIDTIEEALANISEMEADELVASSNVDFDKIEIEEPEKREVPLDLADFEVGDAEVVVSEPPEAEIDTIDVVLEEEKLSEIVSELEADELVASSNVDFDEIEIEEEPALPEVPLDLADFETGDSEVVVNEPPEAEIDTIDVVLEEEKLSEIVSELEADELVASSNVDFDEIEIEEEPALPEVPLDLADFETGDSEVVVNEPPEAEIDTIDVVLEEEKSSEMVSELEADELVVSSNVDFDEIEIEEEPEEPEVPLELEDFETGDAEVVVNEPPEVEIETIEEALGEEVSTEMVSELEADDLASSSNVDFDEIEIEEEPKEPEVPLELEDFETGDTEVVVNEPSEVEIETIEEALGEEVSTEMVSELEADELASSSNVDFDEIEIEEEPALPEVPLELEDFEAGDPEVVVMESNEAGEQAIENKQFTKNMMALVIEQLDLLKQLNPAQYEKELLHSLHDELNEDAFIVLSMHYVEFLKEQNRIDECLAFLQSIEENRVK
ncbi:hypothetical protein [Massilibacterium senegalense]|uniref:hypothetical protein n=1 Tax=Massilibacterium senegalense TaxID=1632858 RepID=UPI0007825DFE|nr:hypothetical protein [Massilibacterium senegalense]